MKHNKSLEELLEGDSNSEEPTELERLRKENEKLKQKLYKANEKVSEYTNKEFKEELEKTKQKIAEYESRIKTIEEQVKEKETKDFYEIGKKLYEEGKYEEAKELFEKCGEDDVNALRYKANCFKRTPGMQKEAIKIYSKVIKKNPSDSNAWYSLGRLQIEKDISTALKSWEKAAELKNEYVIDCVNNFNEYCRLDLSSKQKSQLNKLKEIINKEN